MGFGLCITPTASFAAEPPLNVFVLEVTIPESIANSGEWIILPTTNGESLDHGGWVFSRSSDAEGNQELSTEAIAETSMPESLNNTIEEEVHDSVTPDSETIEILESVETEKIASPPSTGQLGDVKITEFMSAPSDGPEWVEIYNATDKQISLVNWSIEDNTEKQTVLDGNLDPGQYLVIDAIKAQLNNTGDSIILRDAEGNLIDIIAYGNDEVPAPGKGVSMGIAEGVWHEYDIPSPEAENSVLTFQEVDESTYSSGVIQSEESPKAQDKTLQLDAETITDPVHEEITEQKKEAKEDASSSGITDLVTKTGFITALPGTFGKQIAFINGIQLYMHSADWPELTLGDEISVHGILSSARGEPRIKLSGPDQITFTSQKELPSQELVVEEALSKKEGELVTITGAVEGRDGDKLTLKDDTGSVIIVAHANTGISWSNIPTTRIKVTGIIRTINDGVYIYPRHESDIDYLEDPVQPIAGIVNDVAQNESSPWGGIALLSLTSLALFYWYARSKNLLTKITQ